MNTTTQDPRILLRNKADKDFHWFVRNILDYKATHPPLHKKVCEFLLDWSDPQKYIKVLLLPREHLKSTIASISLPLYLWGLDPEEHPTFPCGPNTRIMLSHGKRDMAADYLIETKNSILSKEKLRYVYPDICWDQEKDADVWKSDRFNIKRHVVDRIPSMLASGTNSTVVGFHFDWLIFDDLVFEQNVNTPNLRRKTLQYFQQSQALLRRGGKILVIGTRWHWDDYYGVLMNPNGPYASIVDSLVLQSGYMDGKPIFPVSEDVPKCGFDMERLEQKRLSMSDYAFMCQYENNPIFEVEQSFKEEDIQFFRFDPDGAIPTTSPLNFFTAIDPNRSLDTRNDPCVVLTGAWDSDGKLWVVDITRGHPTGHEIVEWIRAHVLKWNPEFVIVETTAFQQQIVYWLQEDQLKTGTYYKIQEAKRGPTKRKYDRIMAMQPLVEARGLHVRDDFKGLIDELVHFGTWKNDDMVDALADVFAYGYRPENKIAEKKVAHSPFLMKNVIEQLDSFQSGGIARRVGPGGFHRWR